MTKMRMKQLMKHSKLYSVTILFLTIMPEQKACIEMAKLKKQKIAKFRKSFENCI